MATTQTDAPTSATERVRRPWALSVLKQFRPKQWTKNAIVFAGLIFARQLNNPEAVMLATAAFVIFCLLSSLVYVINDMLDVEADRRHPKKRFRPLAAGDISMGQARGLVVVMFLVTVPLAFLLNPLFGLVAATYFVSNLAYSLRLKHVVILDVFLIAAGFVLRAIGGAVVIRVDISPWFLLCTTLAALFLALTKRRHELSLLATGAVSHRRILEEYSIPLLEEMVAVVTSSTVMAYSLYTFFAPNLPSNHAMMWTIPFVLYAIFRYLYLVYRKDLTGSPEEALIRDLPLLTCILLWGLASVAILYFPLPQL
ncbi:MAG: decaprenyl-phosphate phosphoribosyltransferase [Chloroflexi bacterium]|nr:decaprenyl-phosphate phosphoribosyltransferase [Chloroflexota bacterium]